MRHLTLTTAAVALCCAASQAQAGRVDFAGRFHMTAQNAACVSFGDGIQPADFRYRPPNLGTNGTATKLTVIEGWGAENWQIASGSLIGTSWVTVTDTGIAGGAGQITTKMRIRSQVPATLTATTPSVTIIGDIQNFQEDTGCTISFVATGYLQ